MIFPERISPAHVVRYSDVEFRTWRCTDITFNDGESAFDLLNPKSLSSGFYVRWWWRRFNLTVLNGLLLITSMGIVLFAGQGENIKKERRVLFLFLSPKCIDEGGNNFGHEFDVCRAVDVLPFEVRRISLPLRVCRIFGVSK